MDGTFWAFLLECFVAFIIFSLFPQIFIFINYIYQNSCDGFQEIHLCNHIVIIVNLVLEYEICAVVGAWVRDNQIYLHPR